MVGLEEMILLSLASGGLCLTFNVGVPNLAALYAEAGPYFGVYCSHRPEDYDSA
jgi:hypothetical protein